jgi:quinoprotein glucose dehydrogenase
MAIEAIAEYEIGPLFNPPLHRDNDLGLRGSLWCPGDVGGVNIDGPAAADPETGILYVTSRKGCTSRLIAPGAERDRIEPAQTGKTIAGYAVLRPQGPRGPADLPLFKPPYSRITAIDMNTGEHVWMVANGDTPEDVENNPALAGVDIPRTGKMTRAALLVTKTLLFAGEGWGGDPILRAHDKRTGEILAEIELPGAVGGKPMTYMLDGRQYVVVAVGRPNPSELVALALPE